MSAKSNLRHLFSGEEGEAAGPSGAAKPATARDMLRTTASALPTDFFSVNGEDECVRASFEEEERRACA